jgi:hypothetical protein
VKRFIRLCKRLAAWTMFVAVAWLWVSSYQTEQWLWYATGRRAGLRSVGIASCRGTIAISLSTWSRVATSRSIEAGERRWVYRRIETRDEIIEPVPPDARLTAGFGWMASYPQEDAELPVAWRFVILPWWGAAGAGALAMTAVAGARASSRVLRRRPHRAGGPVPPPHDATDPRTGWRWPLPPYVSS